MDSADEVRYDGTYEFSLYADGAVQRRREESPSPALQEARRSGFVPLREVTGVGADLGPLWPTQHRRWCEDLGPELGGDEYDEQPDRWLVRSPWSAVTLPQVFIVLWRWVERDLPPHDSELWAARVAEVLSWDEAAALRLLDAE